MRRWTLLLSRKKLVNRHHCRAGWRCARRCFDLVIAPGGDRFGDGACQHWGLVATAKTTTTAPLPSMLTELGGVPHLSNYLFYQRLYYITFDCFHQEHKNDQHCITSTLYS